MPKTKERPHYKKKYQNELAEEITGRNIKSIQMLMIRHEITLAEAIKLIVRR